MKKRQTRILVLAIIVAFISAGLFMPRLVGAGNMEPSATPGSTMHTLDEIYNKVNKIAPNASTHAAPVENTGQTTSYRAGDDGDEQAGVSWPNPRFTDNSDGTVTDNLTGLIWLKQANYISTGGDTGMTTWNNAIDFCKALATGMCGLSDGSSTGDWRLPSRFELESLHDLKYYSPALSNTLGTGQWSEGDPFTNVQYINDPLDDHYWSSTTNADNPVRAWTVIMLYGFVGCSSKTGIALVWPVRGGQ